MWGNRLKKEWVLVGEFEGTWFMLPQLACELGFHVVSEGFRVTLGFWSLVELSLSCHNEEILLLHPKLHSLSAEP